MALKQKSQEDKKIISLKTIINNSFKSLKMLKSIFIYVLLFIVTSLEAQVHIGPTAQAPDPSAVLELESGFNKGLLLPRMRKIDMLAISNPAEGLTVYLTDEHVSYVFNGTEWVKVHIDGDAFELPYAGTFDHNGAVLNLTNTHLLGTSILGKDTNNGTGIKGVTNTGNGVVGVAEFESGIGGLFVNNNNGISLISDGKTGIGTFYPSNLLHVNGANTEGTTMIVEDDINPVIQLKHYGNNQGYLSVDGYDMVMATNVNNNVGNVVLRTENTDRLIVDNIGNVGIGAPTTNARLYVDGLNTNSNTMVLNDQNPVIQFRHNGANKSYIKQLEDDLILRPNDQNYAGKVIIQAYNDGGWFFIDADGNASLGKDPNTFSGTPNNTRMHIKSNNEYALSLESPIGNTRLMFLQNFNNVTTGVASISAESTEFNINHAEDKYTWGSSNMILKKNEDSFPFGLNELSVYGSISAGTFDAEASLHIINTLSFMPATAIFQDEDPIIYFRSDNTNNNKSFIQLLGDDMKIGTVATNDLGKFVIRTNGGDRVVVRPDGKMVLGSPTGTAPAGTHLLAVKGKIAATEFDVVAVGSWPDYVFDPSYKLKSLEEIETFIKENKHLPNIPAASVIEKEGYGMADMQKKMMEKIEELTLHLIEANKQIKELKEKVKP